MNGYGLARLGRDVEVRTTPSGETVASLSLAFTRRVKGETLTQWVDATLWGKRATALVPYLRKGGQIAVSLEDVHIETFAKRDGEVSHKLAARVTNVELASSSERQEEPTHTPAPTTRPAPMPASSGFDGMDDDIPW